MKKFLTKKNLLYLSVAVIFIVLMAIGTVYDLKISGSLSGLSQSEDGTYSLSPNILAVIMGVIGRWTTPVLGAVSFLFVELNLRRKVTEKTRLILFFVFSVIAAAFMAYGSEKTIETIAGGKLYAGHWVIIVLMIIVLTALLRFIIENVPKKTVRKLFGPALFTAGAVCLLLFSATFIKLVWGRVRLSELVAANSLDGFTKWYKPNFFSGSKSFPSGHTANAALLMLIPLWLGNSEKTRRKRTAVYFGAMAWSVVMGFSRLCCGAHYLTDVTFGFLIGFIVVEITYALYEKAFGTGGKNQDKAVDVAVPLTPQK